MDAALSDFSGTCSASGPPSPKGPVGVRAVRDERAEVQPAASTGPSDRPEAPLPVLDLAG